MIDVDTLVENLDRSTLLVKTGILLVPAPSIAALDGIALDLGLEYVDAANRWLTRLDPIASFAGISRQSLLSQVDEWTCQTWYRRTLLVANIDILMTRLSEPERHKVWSFLHSSLRKRRTGLLFPLAKDDDIVISKSEVDRWIRTDRLASL